MEEKFDVIAAMALLLADEVTRPYTEACPRTRRVAFAA